jgi:hypothetical protein
MQVFLKNSILPAQTFESSEVLKFNMKPVCLGTPRKSFKKMVGNGCFGLHFDFGWRMAERMVLTVFCGCWNVRNKEISGNGLHEEAAGQMQFGVRSRHSASISPSAPSSLHHSLQPTLTSSLIVKEELKRWVILEERCKPHVQWKNRLKMNSL